MKNHIRSLFILSLLAIVLLASSCEDSELTAPAGSILSLVASAVTIDQSIGEQQGETQVVATLTDSSSQPVNDIALFFTTDGGILASDQNFCLPTHVCARAPHGACASDDECLYTGVEVLKTNDSGVIVTWLRMTLADGLDQATVSATGVNLSGSVVVPKTVIEGLDDPEPHITAIPPGGQRTGLPFTLDGTGSQVDDLADPTCFDWTIVSNLNAFDGADGCIPCMAGDLSCKSSCSTRGPNSIDGLLNLIVGQEGVPGFDQTLNIGLRVSATPGVICDDAIPVDDSIFGPNIAVLLYDLDCDLTNPLVDLGSQLSVSLSGDGDGSSVSVSISATATDPEDVPPLFFSWNCGTGACSSSAPGGACSGQGIESVTCTFFGQGTKTVGVTVKNDCDRQATDSVIVEVEL